MQHQVMLALVGIGILSLASQWLAWRFRIPAILFLLASGLVLGPTTGLLNPNELFGDLLFPFISLSVAVILFEGSLTLKFEEIQGHGKVVRNLITVGSTGYLADPLLSSPTTLSALTGNWRFCLVPS